MASSQVSKSIRNNSLGSKSYSRKIPKCSRSRKRLMTLASISSEHQANLLQPHDPARVAAQNHFDSLQEEYNDLWESKYREILARLTRPGGDAQPLARIQALEQKIEGLKRVKEKQTELFKAMQLDQKSTNVDMFEAVYLNYLLNSLLNQEEQLKKTLAQLNFEASQEKNQVASIDPAQAAAEKQLSTLRERLDSLRMSKHDNLLSLLTKDEDKKKDDDDKEEIARNVAERFQKQLKDLLGKLGKELTPVTEEVRKALERAVSEVHQSLEKEGFSPESLGRALEKSQEDLRKAFEGGGAVDKELREAIDRARKDMQDAYDQTKGDVQDQVDALRAAIAPVDGSGPREFRASEG